MAMPLKLVHKYLPMFIDRMNAIPIEESRDSGTCTIKNFAQCLVEKVGPKNPQQIVDEHATHFAFHHGKEPSANSLNPLWWDSCHPDQPQFLFRALFQLGPASTVTPPSFKCANQGILCQPHAENNELRPIEFLAQHVNLVFCRSATMDDTMDETEVMDGFVEIFTSTEPTSVHEIDDLSFVFVKGKGLNVIRANRLDLVHALRVLFYTGYMIYFANPVAFKFCHPLFLITNVFLAQTNFFPSNNLMDHPLSDAQKSNYLLALGLNVFDVMRKPFDAEFFLNDHHLFPATINPTTMPDPLALSFVPQPGAGPDGLNVFTPLYFLFGWSGLQEGTTEDGITAQLFDKDVLINYNAVVQSNEHLPQLTCEDLQTLMIIICKKTSLKLKAKKNFGCKTKADMIALLNQHITAFGTTHATYLQDLDAAHAAHDLE